VVLHVLVQRAAQRNVEYLHAPADREQRLIAGDATPRQREVEVVATGGGRIGLRRGDGAIVPGADVGAPTRITPSTRSSSASTSSADNSGRTTVSAPAFSAARA